MISAPRVRKNFLILFYSSIEKCAGQEPLWGLVPKNPYSFSSPRTSPRRPVGLTRRIMINKAKATASR